MKRKVAAKEGGYVMAKVILVCGKICCGKSTYADLLSRKNNAVVLSVDEIMLSIFGQHCGDMHDVYAERTQRYLYEKAAVLVRAGIDVILDWGFWTKSAREYVKEFFRSKNICFEIHSIDIDDETWQKRLNNRNESVSAGETLAYYVDENLAAKFASLYEIPSDDEIDVWIRE